MSFRVALEVRLALVIAHETGHRIGAIRNRAYGVEHSLLGVVKWMVRIPALLRAMLLHGYWPTRLQGSLTTMPAEFLVDRSGEIRVAHYGRDEGDHLPSEEVARFAKAMTHSGLRSR